MDTNENKVNKTQYAYEVIRTRILDGIYTQGQRIIIDQIAREVGSSHIPVREALRQLESDQLIEHQQNIGAVVRSINDNVYKESLELLAILEGYATANSAPYLRKDDIEELYTINQKMKEIVQSYELQDFGELNKTFHMAIYSRCPNQLLVQDITKVWERLDSVRNGGISFFPARAPQSVTEHEELLKMLVENKSSLEIEAFARQHKLNTLRAFETIQNDRRCVQP
ncbi:DNA-binding GntR family transcriptional regulator [Geomicrobium halophilum]|uniref:DNA-binding GntR family transcriptional regulator n=1 Tax=Geomicrobium halophilum TaxID=549000 RepID=A0A841PQY0_9BACL|nr:GntR family transcriptional regulator [Geomicrobium halophilum]MBB6451297.1 DNA-binding GntR family transcriptional regulator [Geomicrobium halophilum]